MNDPVIKIFTTFLLLLLPSLAHARGDGLAVFWFGVFCLIGLWLAVLHHWFMSLTEPDPQKKQERIKSSKEMTIVFGKGTLAIAGCVGAFVLFLLFLNVTSDFLLDLLTN